MSNDKYDRSSDLEESRSVYRDAYYTASDGQSSYGYNPAHSYGSQAGRGPKRKGKNIGLGAVIIICLACILVAGAAGIGAMYFFLQDRLSEAAETAEGAGEEEMDIYAEVQSAQEAATESLPLSIEEADEEAGTCSAEEIYTLACEQVVGISTSFDQYNIFGQASSTSVAGSGIILSEDGYILTNYHVIESAYAGGYTVTVILHDGETYAADVTGVESDSDLAVLKIEAEGLNAAALGDSDALAVGQTIYAVGNPLGELTYTMTMGIVSALDRTITTDENITVNMFQIDAAVNSGNSGGPVYNVYGQVVGIVTAKYSEDGMEGLGFAIPITDAASIANELITNGYVSGKAYLGLTLTTVSPSVAMYYDMVQGVYVYAVEEGSCSQEAGIQPGDIIVAIDGTEVLDKSALLDAVKQYRAGDSAELTIYRNQDYITVTVVFDEELPAQSQESQFPFPSSDASNA
ncbi:MAG: trypsin-like peptidase domain-containing protein [Oscillospiraceae bacterium]|nr:trypsin-like peptidase domain-containing protein [Oscillospiraceae bacterium]